MSQTTTTSKPGRTASYVPTTDRDGTLELTVTEGKKTTIDGYYVEQLTHDLGPAMRCFRLTRYVSQRQADRPDDYDVCIDPAGVQTSCECRGHLRWSGRPGFACKHVAALASLIAAGRI